MAKIKVRHNRKKIERQKPTNKKNKKTLNLTAKEMLSPGGRGESFNNSGVPGHRGGDDRKL